MRWDIASVHKPCKMSAQSTTILHYKNTHIHLLVYSICIYKHIYGPQPLQNYFHNWMDYKKSSFGFISLTRSYGMIIVVNGKTIGKRVMYVYFLQVEISKLINELRQV